METTGGYLSIDMCFVLVHCCVGMPMTSCLWGATPISGRRRITVLQPHDSYLFRLFCHCFDVMISPKILPFLRRLDKCYYAVMIYTTFSCEIRLTLYKTRSFYIILQRTSTFSLFTWLGTPISLFYSSVSKNKLFGVLVKFELSDFAVVNNTVRKFPFGNYFT